MQGSWSLGPLAIWRAYNDATNAGDHRAASRWLDSSLTVFANGIAAVSSIEQDRAVQSELLRCYPDYVRDYVDGIEAGDTASIEWRMRGTPAVPGLHGLDVPGVSIVRCVNGRLAAARLYYPSGALDRVVSAATGAG